MKNIYNFICNRYIELYFYVEKLNFYIFISKYSITSNSPIMKIVYLLFCILFMNVCSKKTKKYIRSSTAVEMMNRNQEWPVYSKKYKEAISVKKSQIAYIKYITKDRNNNIFVKVHPRQKNRYLRREKM